MIRIHLTGFIVTCILFVIGLAYLGIAEAGHNCQEVNKRTAFLREIVGYVASTNRGARVITERDGLLTFRGVAAPMPLNCLPELWLP